MPPKKQQQPDFIADDFIPDAGSSATENKSTDDQPGFFTRVGQSLGLPTTEAEARSMKPSVAETLGGPAFTGAKMVMGFVRNAKDAITQNMPDFEEAAQNIKEGGQVGSNVGKAAYAVGKGATEAIPIVGHTIQNFGEDIAHKNYSGAAGGATGLATQAVLSKLPALHEALPSTERAGQNFGTAMSRAEKVPIDTSVPGNIALEMKEKAGRGGRLPKVINDFIKTAAEPNAEPINYKQARDFYRNAGELSVEEKNALKPTVKRDIVRFNKSLGKSIQAAADSAGVGEEHASAMKEFRQAKQVQNFKEGAKNIAIGAAKHAIPIGVGGYVAKKIIDAGR